MSDNLMEFLKSNPFWAILIIVLVVLPMLGAVAHIVQKAMGRRGIDNTQSIYDEETGNESDETPDKKDQPLQDSDKPAGL
jgi:hypothetical protein